MKKVREAVRSLTGKFRSASGSEKLSHSMQDFQTFVERTSSGSAVSKITQLSLLETYRDKVARSASAADFGEVEFRAFSQNGEDGILLFLFALLGMGRRRVVEICAGDGMECNAANLIINHGWEALLFDGNVANVERGREFYSLHPDTRSCPPRFVHAWLTRENINQLIATNGFEGEIDLLSLDLDGMDYWIWDALDVINPRVVVAEIQCIWGPERAVSVPYRPDFQAEYVEGFGVYSGASLSAFTKLAARKGYRLVGMQRLGFNAFFVRNGLADDLLPPADPMTCLDVPFVRWATQTLLPLVKDRAWVEV